MCGNTLKDKIQDESNKEIQFVYIKDKIRVMVYVGMTLPEHVRRQPHRAPVWIVESGGIMEILEEDDESQK